MVLRGSPPAERTWSLPGGKIRLGEPMARAAEREVMEETGVVIRAGGVIDAFDVIHRDPAGRIQFHYLVAYLKAEYLGGEPVRGDDVLDAGWVLPAEFSGFVMESATRKIIERMWKEHGNLPA